jgi:hypothetical protein
VAEKFSVYTILFEQVCGTIKGVIEQQGHVFLITSRNDALFEKLFVPGESLKSVEFQNPFYEKLRAGKTGGMLIDVPTVMDDTYHNRDIIYEDGKLKILNESHVFDYYSRQNK